MINRYLNTPVKRDNKGINYYTNTLYPEIQPSVDDIYVLTEIGDRLDILANTYYQDSSYWWIILRANPNKLKRTGLLLKPGIQIRIPVDFNKIINDFENLNNTQ